MGGDWNELGGGGWSCAEVDLAGWSCADLGGVGWTVYQYPIQKASVHRSAL